MSEGKPYCLVGTFALTIVAFAAFQAGLEAWSAFGLSILALRLADKIDDRNK